MSERCPYYKGTGNVRFLAFLGANKLFVILRGVHVIEVSVRRGYTVALFQRKTLIETTNPMALLDGAINEKCCNVD